MYDGVCSRKENTPSSHCEFLLSWISANALKWSCPPLVLDTYP